MSKTNVGHIGYVPGSHPATVFVPTLTATTSTQKASVWVAPADVVVESVTLIAGAAVTGDNTNRINLNIRNGGANGAGTAQIGQLQFLSGVDVAAGDSVTIPCSGASARLNAGDKLVVEAEKVGNGGTWTNGNGFVKFRFV